MAAIVSVGAIAAGAANQLPAIGAGALLFPARQTQLVATPSNCIDRRFDGEGVVLALGAAVALQAAADEPLVRTVIAIATFSDLRTVVMERAPQVLFPAFAIDAALARAERDGRFVID